MVAGVAEVGVGLASLALSPHAEPQAAAVTALLERNGRSLLSPGFPHLPAPRPEGPRGSLRAPRLRGGADFTLLLYLLPRTCSPGTDMPPVPTSCVWLSYCKCFLIIHK